MISQRARLTLRATAIDRSFIGFLLKFVSSHRSFFRFCFHFCFRFRFVFLVFHCSGQWLLITIFFLQDIYYHDQYIISQPLRPPAVPSIILCVKASVFFL